MEGGGRMTGNAGQESKVNVYRRQNVMTASPGELTLMLYDGCIKEIKQMRRYIEERVMDKANEAALRAQAILAELMRSLDHQFELSKYLAGIYGFMIGELVDANIRKEIGKTEVVLEILIDLRSTWQSAIRINRQQTMATGGVV